MAAVQSLQLFAAHTECLGHGRKAVARMRAVFDKIALGKDNDLPGARRTHGAAETQGYITGRLPFLDAVKKRFFRPKFIHPYIICRRTGKCAALRKKFLQKGGAALINGARKL